MRLLKNLTFILAATNSTHSFMQRIRSESETLRIVDLIQSKVFGELDDPKFPQPMSPSEAGPCGDTGQRRYLWYVVTSGRTIQANLRHMRLNS